MGNYSIAYQLLLPTPPQPIRDQSQLPQYTQSMLSVLEEMQVALQKFATDAGTAINFVVVQKAGDSMTGPLDLTKAALYLPVYPGDPVPTPQAGSLYYVDASTDRVRYRGQTAFHSLATEDEIIAMQVKGVNQAVTAGAASTTINFGTAQADTSYGMIVVPSWNTSWWWSGKTTTSVTINWGTVAPSGAQFDFVIWR
jgi:hypothetical protein